MGKPTGLEGGECEKLGWETQKQARRAAGTGLGTITDMSYSARRHGRRARPTTYRCKRCGLWHRTTGKARY